MKNQKCSCTYLVLCLLLCVVPFAGMLFYETDETTENRTLAKWPSVTEDGSLNADYFEELGAYFEDHFSFRKELVTLDARIQSLFAVSNVDTVLMGTDGWLYYTDTLGDYLGTNTMNSRQVFNAANNLLLLQQFVNGQGAEFVFTVAPNKNSLYGEHMPYYAGKPTEGERNMELLGAELVRLGVTYADLSAAFERTDETLYLKRDSHWNAKGALLAYNTIFDTLFMEHETYETAEAVRKKEEIGDLNRMLYPLAAEPEWNYVYRSDSHWNYTGGAQDVEEAWIHTECSEGTGSLLMFRDSFGNTLLPLMAEHFEKGAFSKGTPYLIGRYMEECGPSLVLAEKVERNLDEFLTAPPIMQGPEVKLETADGISAGGTDSADGTGDSPAGSRTDLAGGTGDGNEEGRTGSADGTGDGSAGSRTDCAGGGVSAVRLEEVMEDADYVVLSGALDGSGLDTDARIFVRLYGGEGEADTVYEAFTVSSEQSDYGFMLYLKKDTLSDAAAGITVDILVGTKSDARPAGTWELSVESGA